MKLFATKVMLISDSWLRTGLGILVMKSTKMVGQEVSIHTCIWKVLGSNLDRATGHSDRFVVAFAVPWGKCQDWTVPRPLRQSLYNPMLYHFHTECINEQKITRCNLNMFRIPESKQGVSNMALPIKIHGSRTLSFGSHS
jgi:hypothetical protein